MKFACHTTRLLNHHSSLRSFFLCLLHFLSAPSWRSENTQCPLLTEYSHLSTSYSPILLPQPLILPSWPHHLIFRGYLAIIQSPDTLEIHILLRLSSFNMQGIPVIAGYGGEGCWGGVTALAGRAGVRGEWNLWRRGWGFQGGWHVHLVKKNSGCVSVSGNRPGKCISSRGS